MFWFVIATVCININGRNAEPFTFRFWPFFPRNHLRYTQSHGIGKIWIVSFYSVGCMEWRFGAAQLDQSTCMICTYAKRKIMSSTMCHNVMHWMLLLVCVSVMIICFDFILWKIKCRTCTCFVIQRFFFSVAFFSDVWVCVCVCVELSPFIAFKWKISMEPNRRVNAIGALAADCWQICNKWVDGTVSHEWTEHWTQFANKHTHTHTIRWIRKLGQMTLLLFNIFLPLDSGICDDV